MCVPFACRCLQGQKKVPDLLELELQVVASCLIGVVGTEPRCFARAARALNDWVISPAPRKSSQWHDSVDRSSRGFGDHDQGDN